MRTEVGSENAFICEYLKMGWKALRCTLKLFISSDETNNAIDLEILINIIKKKLQTLERAHIVKHAGFQ